MLFCGIQELIFFTVSFLQGEELYEEAVKKMKIPLSTILDLKKQLFPPPKIVKQMEEIQRLIQDFLSKSPG